MPQYIYKCHKCNELYEVQHGFGDNFSICNQVNPSCAEGSVIERIPQTINYLSKESTPIRPVGHVVDEFIDNTKDDIKEYKKELTNWKYKK